MTDLEYGVDQFISIEGAPACWMTPLLEDGHIIVDWVDAYDAITWGVGDPTLEATCGPLELRMETAFDGSCSWQMTCRGVVIADGSAATEGEGQYDARLAARKELKDTKYSCACEGQLERDVHGSECYDLCSTHTDERADECRFCEGA